MTSVAGPFAFRRRPSERLRDQQPLIRTRIPLGRGAMEQPNATGDGDLSLTVEFWLLLVATGLATGLFGDLLMLNRPGLNRGADQSLHQSRAGHHRRRPAPLATPSPTVCASPDR